MKTFSAFESMPLHCESGSRHDFPRLAREAGFSFNLYRGRVDWAKIGSVDVDKIVRERDLETLQDMLSCVMSCNLSSEYDLKILDPNFIKIFQLAQLAADFLLYCRTYLDHCVTVMQDQLRIALQEIEHLRKKNQENADEICSLQKKLKTKMRSRNSSPHPIFKCSGCEKIFVGEQYLTAHQQRRHPELVTETVSNNSNKEVENLKFQVRELQERLQVTENALKEKQSSPISDVAALQAILQNEIKKINPTNLKGVTPSLDMFSQDKSSLQNCSTTSERQENARDQVENSQVDTLHDGSTTITDACQQLKVKYESSQKLLLARVDEQDDEIKALREQLHEQHLAHERAMQEKLVELQHQHQADLDDLRLSIMKNRGSGDHFMKSPDINTNRVQNDIQDSPINTVQAWDRSSDNSETFKNIATKKPSLQISNSKVVHTGKSSVNHSTDTNPVKEESAYKEEIVLTVDQDSSSASSQTSSDQQTNSNQKSTPAELLQPDKDSTVDMSQKSPMYNKSSSSGSGTSSQGSCSSYDSDSQSSNSGQNSLENDSDQSKLQLAPQVLDGLKEDLLGLLNRRLRELGVDPEWQGIPAASFHSNMATVKHHQNIAAKSHKSYFEIQEAILKEVDRQITDRLKIQQSTSNSSDTAKKKGSRHATEITEKNQKSPAKSKPQGVVENTYSNEPSTSYSRPMNDYEALQIKKTAPDLSQRKDLVEDVVQKAEELSRDRIVTQHLSPSASSNMTNEPDLGIKNSMRVYSRSMYANLNKSEIEVEKKESSSSDSSVEKPQKLQTSTPIKSSSQLSQAGSKKPTFMASDVESISELESDLNDIMENTSVKPNVSTGSRPHTSLTTAELLANVAKFRQSTGQMSSTQSIVKSNLKSSFSTGNIKKKVVFRDEKDGFDTIELGPAHSSYESIPPQRSHSENSLAITSSSPLISDRPVPQPRNSLAQDNTISTVSNRADTDSDGDWDWDKDLSDTLTLKKSTEEILGNARRFSSGASDKSLWSNKVVEERRWSIGSTESSKVSEIVRDFERKLQEKREKPVFGIHTARPQSSVIVPDRFSNISRTDSFSSTSMLKGVASGNNNSSESNLAELLVDDISSS
ncbi:Zinc finger protein DZIP1L [Frankliniella fusca]|uniref:Zinc finger protein DZIP1L n=1 Tax=Frankliniella fusca TaxID=407009 RepID=A0AAE1I3T9_9NEOP|nr:Zinc finger protein DZIP1L [Frankliniella fusca]